MSEDASPRRHPVRSGGRLIGQNRLRLVVFAFVVCFLTIGGRLAQLTLLPPPEAQHRLGSEDRIPRPDIVDRNGVVLASDISIPSLYADPRKIGDVDETVERLTGVLPELNARELRDKLTQDRAFVWLKRDVSPRQKEMIHNLGLAGVGFRKETRRVYPMGRLAAHVLGYVDVDSRGLAGIEKYLDDHGALYAASLADPKRNSAIPAALAIDVRVQHALGEEIAGAMAKFRAVAGAGVLLDARTGEVLAAVSLPDFNPNAPDQAQDKTRMNRFSGGVFELGSSVKTATFAMALDAGVTRLEATYDCRFPLAAGRSRIDDFHATRRILTVEEIFTHSSNIGTAQMALDVGVAEHQEFLRRIGFFDRLQAELPEAAAPLLPERWGRVHTMTAAFGHGLSIQPLQLARAAAAFVNGGMLIEPTFLKRDPEAVAALSKRIISEETSATLRHLLRLNVEKGTATKANAAGYRVGGKTGSAEKVVAGRYSKDHRLTTFLGAFPMDHPKYVLLVLLDEPHATSETHGFATAGWNAVPTAGNIIGRIAPILGIEARVTPAEMAGLVGDAGAGIPGD